MPVATVLSSAVGTGSGAPPSRSAASVPTTDTVTTALLTRNPICTAPVSANGGVPE
ncbi:Uncharacterised protein [Mycobacteroides abscessus subsp. abscessus]|nr:Uncharacterised protein [Mycobacteroides abscessus subsp. abscessus]